MLHNFLAYSTDSAHYVAQNASNYVNERHLHIVSCFALVVAVVEPHHWACKPASLMLVPSQDKVGGLRQEGHPV